MRKGLTDSQESFSKTFYILIIQPLIQFLSIQRLFWSYNLFLTFSLFCFFNVSKILIFSHHSKICMPCNRLQKHSLWQKFMNSLQAKEKCQSLIHAQLFAAPWTVASQVPLSMEFSRQEYWCGQLFSRQGDLSENVRDYPGIFLNPQTLNQPSAKMQISSLSLEFSSPIINQKILTASLEHSKNHLYYFSTL